MAAEKETGVIARVKSLMSGGGTKPRIPVSGLNLPWLLARCDSAFQELLPLLKGAIFVKDTNERCEYYGMLADMTADILESLMILYRESAKASQHHKVEPDPGIPVLQVVYHSFRVLHESAILNHEMLEQKGPSESFAGTGILMKFNGIEDALSNMEVEMLHNVSELVESIVPAMLKNSEQRKKSLSKNGAECYERARKELSLHYSGLSANN
ncbi:MAG: hypothetical protein IKB25_02150 [Lentisphaeria bacterium]|nr:hypothetical protein [Lentisphaeria bacterium]